MRQILEIIQHCNQETIQYDEFKEIFTKVLNAHAPKNRGS